MSGCSLRSSPEMDTFPDNGMLVVEGTSTERTSQTVDGDWLPRSQPVPQHVTAVDRIQQTHPHRDTSREQPAPTGLETAADDDDDEEALGHPPRVPSASKLKQRSHSREKDDGE